MKKVNRAVQVDSGTLKNDILKLIDTSVHPTEQARRERLSPLADWDQALAKFLREIGVTREENTEKTYGYVLRSLVAWQKAHGVSMRRFCVDDMYAYSEERKAAGKSARTRRHDASVANTFCCWAVDRGILPSNPLAKQKLPKVERQVPYAPDKETLARLFSVMEARWQASTNSRINNVDKDRRDFYLARAIAIIAFQAETGCRIGEVLSLKVHDYHPRDGHIIIRDPKDDQWRTSYVSNPLVMETVRVSLEERMKYVGIDKSSDYLFVNRKGQRIEERVIQRSMRELREWAMSPASGGATGVPLWPDMPRLTTHCLRKFNGTCVSGVSVKAAAEILGHASTTQTQTYMAPDTTHAKRAHLEAAPMNGVLDNLKTLKYRKGRR